MFQVLILVLYILSLRVDQSVAMLLDSRVIRGNKAVLVHENLLDDTQLLILHEVELCDDWPNPLPFIRRWRPLRRPARQTTDHCSLRGKMNKIWHASHPCGRFTLDSISIRSLPRLLYEGMFDEGHGRNATFYTITPDHSVPKINERCWRCSLDMRSLAAQRLCWTSFKDHWRRKSAVRQ